MVSKCANPNCSAAFHHRRGRLFRFPKRPVQDSCPAPTDSVQHFWLCEVCSATYSLEYHEAKGVALRRHLEEENTRKFIAVA